MSRHPDTFNRSTLVPAVEAALLALSLPELRALLAGVPGSSTPALARASEEALRSAARTYLRTGRLQAAQIINAKGKA